MNTFSRSDIGKRLAQIRGQQSHQDFAERIGVHKNTYGGYERGQSEIGAESLHQLALEGWNANWVLTGEGPERLDQLLNIAEERASYGGSHPLSHPNHKLSIQLAQQALDDDEYLEPGDFAELVVLIYDALTHGLPSAQVLALAKPAARGMRSKGDGRSVVGGAGERSTGESQEAARKHVK